MANTHSIDLNGSSQWASITDASQSGLDLSTDFTFEAWVNIASSFSEAETRNVISKTDNAGTQRAYKFFVTKPTGVNHRLSLYLSTSGSNNFFIDSDSFGSALSNDTWYHIAVNYDLSAGTAQFFLDGSQVGSDNTGNPTSIFNGNHDFEIGRTVTTTPTQYWDGLLDEVRVWGDKRTGTEINDNKDAELTGSEADLISYWKFNNDFTDSDATSGNTLTNNGTITFSTDVPFVGAATFIPKMMMF